MTKTDISNYLLVADGMKRLCDCLVKAEDKEQRKELLVKCQEIAIDIGNHLEETVGIRDKKYIKEHGTIGKLEQLCEALYRCSIDYKDVNVNAIRRYIGEAELDLTHMPVTYRVVFLPYKASMWDSLESIWREFAADEACETSVVPIPFFEANHIENRWEECYEGNLFPRDVPIINYNDYLLQYKKPDLVFVHNPFDSHNHVTTVHPAFYSQELKKHCRKLIYVPYFVNPGFVSGLYNKLPLLWRSDYIVLQSEHMKETCREFPYYDRVLPYGSPKFDKVLRLNREGSKKPQEWKIDNSDKKFIMLNTTIDDFLNNGEKLLRKLKNFFEKVRKREDVVIIWRPHPLLEGTVKSMRTKLYDSYKETVGYFSDNKVGVFDTTADVSMAVAATDAYIGSSYSSIIALFEVCGKPVFKFDSQNIYGEREYGKKRACAEDVFKMKNEKDFFGAEESYEYMFDDFIDDLVNGRLNEVRNRQLIAEAGISSSPDGDCGRKVYEHIMRDLRNE